MIYLDNGATTPVDPLVVEAMLPHYVSNYGNPSSLHHLGATAAGALRRAREIVAGALGVEAEEIAFTGGGTEADNIGMRGPALSSPPKRKHALIFTLEHPAVRSQRAFLERLGFTVEEIPCTADGLCDLDAFEGLLRKNETALVGIMHANNEIGTIQPLDVVGEIIADRCPAAHLHVDAVQSFTKAVVRPRSMRADTMAFAAHKLHGPKGVGALYVRKGARVRPLVSGGGQERGVRPGTENIPGIVGFAKAVELAMETHRDDIRRMTRLRDLLLDRLTALDGVRINGHRTERLCNNINVTVDGARAEVLLHELEAGGVLVSSGSACHAGQSGPSHVLKAIGLTEADTGTLRITLSRLTTEAEVTAASETLVAVIKKHGGSHP
ncbi:MAG: cysteine desulfurase [Myxococcota bacterium]|jgi:cysteine desulfurase